MNTAIPTIEVLLGHQRWVRQLARSLVADPSRAEDVAQETMLEAISRPPRDLSRPRAWLFGVARNAARAIGRGERRRVRREHRVARHEATSIDPAEVASRAELHRRLVEALFELDEPYHTVLVLRYFEDLDARRIAAQLDRPLATVRTQLQRGLERLRERLDREFGDRVTWRAALAPLIGIDRAAAAGATGLAGSLPLWGWATAAAVLLAALWLGIGALGGDASRTPFASVTTPAAAVTDASARAVDPPTAERRVVGTPVATAGVDATEAGAAPAPGIRGRVIGFDGQPVPNLSIARVPPETPRIENGVLIADGTYVPLDQEGLRGLLETAEGRQQFAAMMTDPDAVLAVLEGRDVDVPRTTSGADGRFELREVGDGDHLQIEDRGWTIAGTGDDPDTDELIVVAARGLTVHGRVLDEAGTPLAGVSVATGYDVHSLSGVAEHLPPGQSYRSRQVETDGSGHFELRDVPLHPDIDVTINERGYRYLAVSVVRIEPPVEWVLQRKPEDPGRTVLTGVVLRHDGPPADGASVVFGQDSCSSGPDGRFVLPLSYCDRGRPLIAWLPGLQPAIVPDFGERLAADRAAGRELVLRLGPPALRLAGRVLDAAGEPMVGAHVTLVDGTRNGTWVAWVESAIGEQGWHGEETDDQGRFELRGLGDRAYTLRARDDATMLVIQSEPTAAGTTDVTLRAPEDALLEELRGTLVDRRGAPIEGAQVGIAVRTFEFGNGEWSAVTRPDVVETDAEGGFVLKGCPRRHVFLSIHGPGVQGTQVALDPDARPLRIQVARFVRFSVRPRPNDRADRFAVLDVDGQPLTMTACFASVTTTMDVGRLADLAAAYEVDDRAVTMVLYAGDEELRRVPLYLRPGESNRVDL
ncbi:MAG: sigma-70 family RNA polymerase sigma factor [Planctomycetes bacterium]|nr:sigma-70 family RNA polymerase sigma factor [Planctomycetota bacterium]